jgi:hypothetical protein
MLNAASRGSSPRFMNPTIVNTNKARIATVSSNTITLISLHAITAFLVGNWVSLMVFVEVLQKKVLICVVFHVTIKESSFAHAVVGKSQPKF